MDFGLGSIDFQAFFLDTTPMTVISRKNTQLILDRHIQDHDPLGLTVPWTIDVVRLRFQDGNTLLQYFAGCSFTTKLAHYQEWSYWWSR